MKKLFLAVCCTWLFMMVKAQVTMTLQVPPAGVLLKSQLWNVSFSNSDVAISCAITLVLTDGQTNQPVLNATTKAFTVAAGASVLTEMDLAPINYEYPADLITDRSADGFLNVGQYHACYTLNKFDHGSQQLLEDCMDITVEPVSPPMLILPADQDTVLSNTPQFNWLPPNPLNIFGNLNYDFLLVEVQQGQTPALAIQQNVPVYATGSFGDVFLSYPISYQALDTGKLYAWQVIAKDNDRFGAQSEIWTFTVKPPTIINLPISDGKPYIKLKEEQDASLALCDGVIKVVYTNDENDSLAAYTITSLEEGNAGELIKSGSISLRSGENFIDVLITTNDTLADDKTYLFELVNSRNEKWTMKFIYHSPAGN